MEKKDFTLNYFGKDVAVTQEGHRFTVQISYVPLNIEKRTAANGETQWLDIAQGRETQLSKEIGCLLEAQGLSL